MEELRDQRSERAARHDDRAFGAERSAGADGDGGRERLEKRYPRLHPAAVDKDPLDGFGNAVPPDALRAVTRHESNDDRAYHGHNQHQDPEVVVRRRDKSRAPALEEEKRLVKRPISLSSASATKALIAPTPIAIKRSRCILGVAMKSPKLSVSPG